MLTSKKKYLQVALNSALGEAAAIIRQLPPSDRILIEAGTPLIKAYGNQAITSLRLWWADRLIGTGITPYIVADLKCMDRGDTEATNVWSAGASGAVVLGEAPVETINAFVDSCENHNIDSMIDMMNVDQPIKVLRLLKKLPNVVILHRGVDEESYNRDKPIPYIQINKIRSSFDTMISIAGGDTIREVQRAIFNGADIVIVWKEFYHSGAETGQLAQDFLGEIN
jgi:bifunctional enzyme Fae/Hps